MSRLSVSNKEINRLGERLVDGTLKTGDDEVLNEFRGSFTEAHAHVMRLIRDELELVPSGRPVKRTESIVAKLRRQNAAGRHPNLSNMQDIAGCRVIVQTIAEQDEVVRKLRGAFEHVRIDDKRNRPASGYRAVHVVVRIDGKPIEIQVRTRLQHMWANYVESVADAKGIGLKYGQPPPGTEDLMLRLLKASRVVEILDSLADVDGMVDKHEELVSFKLGEWVGMMAALLNEEGIKES